MRKLLLLLIIIIVLPYASFSQLNNVVFDRSTCGLNIIHNSAKVTNRFVTPSGAPYPIQFTINQLPSSCYTIEAAYLWSVVSYRAGTPNPMIVTVNNPLSEQSVHTGFMTGQAGTKCWQDPWGELGTRGWRADVASAIKGNGNYTFEFNFNPDEMDGVTLLIIYRDLNANYEGHLLINDGLITVKDGVNSANLTGPPACAASSNAQAFSIVSDIQNGAGGQLLLTMNGVQQGFSRNFWNSEIVNTSVTAGQSSYAFAVDPNGSDCYSWLATGVYFQTTTCATCPQNPLKSIAGGLAEYCFGGSAQIGNAPTGGNPPYKFQWNPVTDLSDPTIQNPIASPKSTTTYTLTVTDSKGCSSSDNVLVQVNPLPILNAGPDKTTCFGIPVQIGNPATNGTPAFTYSWKPTNGLSASNLPVVSASPNDTTTYIVTVTDSKNCIAYDTIKVNIMPLPQVAIVPPGPVIGICSCDSVTLQADGVFPAYKWSTNETTRSIVVKTGGNYTVTVTDKNGCVNTSKPVTVSIIQPTATVALPQTTIAVPTGQFFDVPVRLISSNNLDTCKAKNFYGEISFQRTIMVPTGNTPKGTMTIDRRIIPFQGIRTSGDSLLATLHFQATLGEVEQSSLQIESFGFAECAFPVVLLNDSVRLTNLCKEGGITRLFFSGIQPSMSIQPNPSSGSAEIKYDIPDGGFVQIYLKDLLGNSVKDVYSGNQTSGEHSISADMSSVPDGIYMILLVSQSKTISQMVVVRK